ncbi:MAG: hypothetical protein ACLQUZ_08775 [Rhizomicrobium sp.]
MHSFDEVPSPAPTMPYALCIWAVCLALLVGPSVLVWSVRTTALANGCAPGPQLCRGMTMGAGLRDTLQLAWLLGSNALMALAIAFAAAVAALSVRRPLMAALGLLVLPLAAVLLPTLAVITSSYGGCQVNEDGIGDCLLWGAKMGMSFHTAATASAALYDTAPFTFALALMVAAVGFIFFRPRPAQGR